MPIDSGSGLGTEVAVLGVEIECTDAVFAADTLELYSTFDPIGGVVSHALIVVLCSEGMTHHGGLSKVICGAPLNERNGDSATVNVSAACGAVWNTAGMGIQPQELPLHLSRIETSRGGWLIAVHSIAEAQIAGTLLLKLILEQSIDDEHFRTRELGMQVLAVKLYDPDLFPDVVGQIRRWIETTEGDGFLELSEPGQ